MTQNIKFFLPLPGLGSCWSRGSLANPNHIDSFRIPSFPAIHAEHSSSPLLCSYCWLGNTSWHWTDSPLWPNQTLRDFANLLGSQRTVKMEQRFVWFNVIVGRQGRKRGAGKNKCLMFHVDTAALFADGGSLSQGSCTAPFPASGFHIWGKAGQD